MKIFKYHLQVTERQIVQLPKGAELLTVQIQRHQPCLWALVEETAPLEPRAINLYATGESIPNLGKYLGTIQLDHGHFVLHAFTGA